MPQSEDLNTQSAECPSVVPKPFDVTVIVNNETEQSTPINIDDAEFIYRDNEETESIEEKDDDRHTSKDTSDTDTDSDGNEANLSQLIGTKGGNKQLVCINIYPTVSWSYLL